MLSKAPTALDASLAAVGADTCIRDIVHAFPWSLELLFKRGISPTHGALTLAEVAAMNHFRVESFLEALREAAEKHRQPAP